jgi:hypothetical protein
VKESRNRAKDGPDADKMMVEMRKRYDRATDAERTNRLLALDDFRFVTIPGSAWEEYQVKARGKRPRYEFPILRSHVRQVCNDQKKSRPGIKVRAVSEGSQEGAELRQGIIRNIESVSNADWAYDQAFEMLVSAGFGAWRVETKYSTDDSWDQDLCISPIKDVLSSVWSDPDGPIDDPCGEYTFVEEMIPRDVYEAKYPNAEAVSFESAGVRKMQSWFGKDDVRVAEYWRKVPVTKTILLLSDGRSVDEAAYAPIADEQAAKGITVIKTRSVKTTKVVMSIVNGEKEIEGPFDSVFHKIPIVQIYANRQFIDGKWTWMGMVRPSKDAQRLVNYNLTTAQEVLAKQQKATPVITAKMLEGEGIQALWDASNAIDTPYLPFTPDPLMPGGPTYLSPPPLQNAFLQMGQFSIDMLKASDNIHDASLGARSNETSGKAIMARQAEGDTATYDYQDALARGIQLTGELLGSALPAVMDTPRVVRIIGKDGGETWKKLYSEEMDTQTGQMVKVNDLSAGKYDYTVTTGPSYDTQRMEFVDALVTLSQSNPQVGAVTADLVVGAMDFPKSEETAKRLQFLLPPPIQKMLAEGAAASPEVQQVQAQMDELKAQGEQAIAQLTQALQEAQQAAQSSQADTIKAQADAQRVEIDQQNADTNMFKAETERLKVEAEIDLKREQHELAEIKTDHQIGKEYHDTVSAMNQPIEPLE